MICSPFAPNTTPLVPRRELRLDGLLNQEYGRLTLHSVSCQSSLVFILFLYSSLGNSQPHPSRIDGGSTTQRERTASHQKPREDNQPREVSRRLCPTSSVLRRHWASRSESRWPGICIPNLFRGSQIGRSTKYEPRLDVSHKAHTSERQE